MDQSTLFALIAVGFLIAVAFILNDSGGAKKTARIKAVGGNNLQPDNIMSRLRGSDQNSKRKQIEDSLSKIEEREKHKKKKSRSLEMKLVQADWAVTKELFTLVSIGLAILFGGLPFIMGMKPLLCLGLAVFFGFGLPRFVLNFIITRRQKKFINNFADAMDVVVRGVRTGLPLGDCLKIIAHESPDPLGAEFRKVVEGEALGIPIDICLEQMHDRMPLPEVNFFSTVLKIQRTSGGNLGESLSNLSTVLRGRKILREKIKALSSEAKASAIIIAALPVVVMGLVTIMAPDYMEDLYYTTTGQRNLMIGAGMMVVGVVTMRKMINFKI